MPTQHTPLLELPYPSSGTDLVAEGDDVLRELVDRLEVVVGPPSGTAGGDLGGTYPSPQVVTINGVAVSAVVFTSDTRLSDARPPTGAAGGDLAGSTYPNPVVATINGRAKTAVVFTDDSRLGDARAPTVHAASHRAGGSDALSAIAAAAVQVRDVGEVGQIRAGRVLTPADFTTMGLTAPAGLWNLSNVNDSSGNARNLTNKGAVPFGPGIMGAATEAAVFAGSTGQALYIVDTGAADPFRIKVGAWGCWFRTAKRGSSQSLVTKISAAAGNYVFSLSVTASNVAQAWVSLDGTALSPAAVGASDVIDDRWHFAVATFDGTSLRLYVDGALEASTAGAGVMFAGNGPLNIGAQNADAATAGGAPNYGRIDEAFVTSDVLCDDQIRNLYCTRIAHALAVTPTAVRLAVRRRKRGGTLATSDFPATPLRLHNFAGGSLADSGSGGVVLVTNPGTGAQFPITGANGEAGGAFALSGAHLGLSASDAGLPSALAARSYGCWFKTIPVGAATIIGWGTVATADARMQIGTVGNLGSLSGADAFNGPVANDGLWHHGVTVEDNAAADGVKRKLYMDGRLVGGSTVLTSLTLAGAGAFRMGADPGGTAPFTGQVDGGFVYAGALTPEQVRAVYNVGSQALAPSPKAAGAHVEALEAASLLATFDTVEGCDQVDLSVAV